MSYTVTLQQRLLQLKKIGADLPEILYEVQKNAAMRAVEAAVEATPPKVGDLRGTGTRSGELKKHWITDSEVEPRGGGISGGGIYRSLLKNDLEYASYVNDGHRVDRHFVPGLYINPNSNQLEYDPAYAEAGGGLVVGTKTTYVKGKFMTDKGKEAYEKAVLSELDRHIQELMK